MVAKELSKGVGRPCEQAESADMTKPSRLGHSRVHFKGRPTYKRPGQGTAVPPMMAWPGDL